MTLLNGLTIGVPAFFIMLSRQRSAVTPSHGFLREVGGFALFNGVVIGLAGLAVMLLAPAGTGEDVRALPQAAVSMVGLAGSPAATGPLVAATVPDAVQALYLQKLQRTLVLTAVILLGLVSLGRILRDGDGRRSASDTVLWCWLAAALPLYAVAMYWPFANDFFQLTPLTGSQWLWVLAVAGPAAVLCWLPLGRWFLGQPGTNRRESGHAKKSD